MLSRKSKDPFLGGYTHAFSAERRFAWLVNPWLLHTKATRRTIIPATLYLFHGDHAEHGLTVDCWLFMEAVYEIGCKKVSGKQVDLP